MKNTYCRPILYIELLKTMACLSTESLEGNATRITVQILEKYTVQRFPTIVV